MARLEAFEELGARYAVGGLVAGGGIGVMPGRFWGGGGGHALAVILVNEQIGGDEDASGFLSERLWRQDDRKVHSSALIRMLFGSWLCHGVVVIGSSPCTCHS